MSQITIETSARVIRSSLAFQIVGSEDGVYAYALSPINDGGSITFSAYTPNDEGGYSLCEDTYTFRDGKWYWHISYEGRDCDGYTSSESEWVWLDDKWNKLGRTRCRDQFAESMGY